METALLDVFPIRMSADDYREEVADAIAQDLEPDRRVDAKLFNGVCAFVERFLHGRAMYVKLKLQHKIEYKNEN